MKLEPKHIIKHLPYDVQVLDFITNKVFTLDVGNLSQTLNDIEHLNSAKLALHPLSDLTKPITHKGETFVPLERLDINPLWFGLESWTTNCEMISVKEYEQLLEWHFDIDNLIGHGLAVDINTLK